MGTGCQLLFCTGGVKRGTTAFPKHCLLFFLICDENNEWLKMEWEESAPLPEIHPEGFKYRREPSGGSAGEWAWQGALARGEEGQEVSPGPTCWAQLGLQGAEESDTVCSLGELPSCWGRWVRTQGERNITSQCVALTHSATLKKPSVHGQYCPACTWTLKMACPLLTLEETKVSVAGMETHCWNPPSGKPWPATRTMVHWQTPPWTLGPLQQEQLRYDWVWCPRSAQHSHPQLNGQVWALVSVLHSHLSVCFPRNYSRAKFSLVTRRLLEFTANPRTLGVMGP